MTDAIAYGVLAIFFGGLVVIFASMWLNARARRLEREDAAMKEPTP